MSPLYDAVTTRVFPQLKHDRLALKLNGKDDRLSRTDFRMFASTIRLKAADAEAAIDQMAGRLHEAVETITLPKGLEYSADATKALTKMKQLSRDRIESVS